jgi:four helix bundle protein
MKPACPARFIESLGSSFVLLKHVDDGLPFVVDRPNLFVPSARIMGCSRINPLINRKSSISPRPYANYIRRPANHQAVLNLNLLILILILLLIPPMKAYFDHEKLEVYRKSVAFAAWSETILERVPKSTAVHGQLDRARTSIVLNISEGNGRFTPADRCRFFDIARGSGLECAGCLDLLFIKNHLSEAELDEGKSLLKDIVSLLIGLIRSNSPDRLHEDQGEYRVGGGD